MNATVHVAGEAHASYAEEICSLLEISAQQRGTGIARRSPDYVMRKIESGNAVIALTDDGKLAGFCYIEIWSHGKYVANSGLVVAHDFRQLGLAKQIKRRVFDLARDKYPSAKVFGITTSLAVMKINSELGYKPVTFSELTQDETFWDGCQSCPNFDILQRCGRKMCLCTGMLAPSKLEELEAAQSVSLVEMILKNETAAVAA
ncbi:MAG: GNAT family N-acetyltransferase [Saprospiraceae bacterium]|nr:GNAT family N-acetyltransferase [Saprospiraceae bacterium]